MRQFVLILFLIGGQVVRGQNFDRYFKYDFFPQDDFSNYSDVAINWNFDGKLQTMVNAGITELKEGDLSLALGHLDEAIAYSPDFWIPYYYRGITKKILGQLDGAIADFTIANNKTGGMSEIHTELGEIFQSERKLDLALKHFDKARDLSPDKVDGYLGIANVAFLSYDADKAIRFYKKCIEINPKFPDAYLRIALLKLYANRREKQALTYFDQALEAEPNYQLGLFWRGLISTEFNNLDQAMKDWSLLIKLQPENAFFHIMRGFLFIEKQDYELAFTDIKNSILKTEVDESSFKVFGSININRKIDLQVASQYLVRNIYGLSDSVSAPLKKGYCLLVSERIKEAITALDLSIKLEPTASAYFIKALAHEYNNEPQAAFECYDNALKFDDEIFDAHKKRAIYRTKQKDYRGAALDFLKMEQLQPENMITYKLRGLLKSNLKDFYGTIVDLTKYLRTDSLNEELLIVRANASMSVGEYKLAQSDFKKLCRLDSANASFPQQLYITFLLQKDTTSAWNTLESYQKIFPDYAFSYIQKMEIHIMRKQWDKALSIFEKFDLRFSQNSVHRSEALFLKALVYLYKEEKESALETFSKSIQTGQAVNYISLDALYNRGKLYWDLGKKKKAVEDFEVLMNHGYSLHQEFISTVLNSKG